MALSVAGIASATSKYVILPQLNEKGFKNIPQRTKIFASDGTLLSTFYYQNRETTSLDNVPEHLIKATIAIEDQRFFDHDGVDVRSVMRALVANVKEGSVVEGGSTISQQLIKNIFLNNERTMDRKLREAILAYQLEHRYTKNKILELYLNTVYYGNGAHGIKTASELYFGKEPTELTLSEAALLAGMPKAPSRFSPYIDPQKAQTRREQVLKRMVDMEFISEIERDAAIAERLTFRPTQARLNRAPYFVEFVRQTLKKKYGAGKLYGGGMNVYTTIDLGMQANAEKTVNETLNRTDDPSAALVCIDPKTGFIKAAVGGRDFDADQFDLAIQGRRQAGSAFKTFVLVTALTQGISPKTTFSGSSPISLPLGWGQSWSVKNYGGSSMGSIPLSEATVKSVNVVYAQLILKVGAANVSRMANRMGIESPVDSIPAIALGGLSRGVSPLDMASAYGTIANKGEHVKATPISRITNLDGEVIYNARAKKRRVISKEIALTVTEILQEVVKRGTGTAAKLGNRPVAGKTGTAENLTDAWFVGFTPQLVTAVWVGYPHAKVPMNSVHGMPVTGGSFPARIWKTFMAYATRNMAVVDFENNKIKKKIKEPPRRLATPVAPEPKPAPEPEPELTPPPEPTPEPTPEPPSKPEPKPKPEPTPKPVPPPAPTPPTAPKPEPLPVPEPETPPAPTPPPDPASG